jgi:hypothetical protein
MTSLSDLLRPRRYFHLRSKRNKQEFGMTTRHEQHWLRTYAAQTYRGTGAIVDLGCFLGASTISLAQGLALNSKIRQKQIHAYDLFIGDEFYEAWAKGKQVEGLLTAGGSFLPEFLRRTQKWRDQIVVHEEDLRYARWEEEPIEFLFIDAMKSPELATAIASEFFSQLVPGQSYVAHQDFAHYYTSWIHLLQFRLRDCFEVIADIPGSGTVVFRCQTKLSPGQWGDLSLASAPPAEIEAAFAYSMGLVSEDKKINVLAAKAMAYVHRGELERARQVLEATAAGTKSLGGELETARAMMNKSNQADNSASSCLGA